MGGGITYASGNKNVAIVDENSGEVTIVGAGVALITATAAGTDNYEAATAAYTLTVTGHITEIRNAKDATCTEDGYTGDTVCTVCEETVATGEVIPATGHTSGEAVKENEVAATCTSDGSYDSVVSCTVCGTEISRETITVSATGHSFGSWELISSPTCEDDGSEIRTCSVCGFVETQNLDATGHDWEIDYTVDQEATCTTDGSRSIHCKICDAVKDSEAIPATGHTIEIWNAKDASCTEDGYTGDEVCKVCGETVKTGEVISAAGHIWGKGVVTKEPTSTASGTRTYTCTVCGKTRTETIPATGGTIKDGLVLDEDNVFRYYQNNVFAKDYVGVVPYDGGLFFIKNGLIDFDANELCLYEDVWYYVSLGQVQLQYTGFAIHDGAWFYVTEGILDTTVNGLIPYDGERFLVAAGRMVLEYSSLWLNSVIIGGDNQWYFIGAGMLQKVSCVVLYDGAWFVVENGILDTDYNGTMEYDGVLFQVVNGQLYS